MPKVSRDEFKYQYLIETEDLIRKTPKLYAEMKTGNNSNDFNELDVVKCTYIKGMLRVVGKLAGNKIVVESLIDPKDHDTEVISADFLKKVKIDEDVLDLLYVKNN